MKIIKNINTLKSLQKKLNFEFAFDLEYKYILSDFPLKVERHLRTLGYDIKYFSGCFYPFIIQGD